MGRAVAFLVVALQISLGVGTLAAATITVSSTQDLIANDGQCTLREAIIAANDNAPSGAAPGECPSGNSGVADTVVLPAATIMLSILGGGESASAENPLVGDLDIIDSLNILGQGSGLTAVEAGIAVGRVFHIDENDAQVSFTGLEISGGNTSGRGGGIYFEDGLSLDLLDVDINGNVADDDGGGLYATNTAALSVRGSRISANFADDDGGGITWSGCFNCSQVLLIEDTIIEGNGTTGGFQADGGGIWAGSGTFFLTDTSIAGNHADDDGGGMYVESSLRGSRFTVRDNTSDTRGGAIYFDFPGTSFLENCTLSSNSAQEEGGAIAIITNDTVTLTNCTVTDNTAPLGSALGEIDQITLANTIISGTCDGDPVLSLGGNIESPGDNCGLVQSTDQVAISAIQLALGPLADNGGLTLTHLPGESSVAISQARDVLCPDEDQRGEARPQGTGCEVGAVERISPLFEDDFESGSLVVWASTQP